MIKLKYIVILCITFLETIALIKNIDGFYFSLVVGSLCGLAGYEIRKARYK